MKPIVLLLSMSMISILCMQKNIMIIPQELILHHVVPCLGTKSVLSLSGTCHTLHDTCKEYSLKDNFKNRMKLLCYCAYTQKIDRFYAMWHKMVPEDARTFHCFSGIYAFSFCKRIPTPMQIYDKNFFLRLPEIVRTWRSYEQNFYRKRVLFKRYLQEAVNTNDTNFLRLLTNGSFIDINSIIYYKLRLTLLHQACMFSSNDIVKFLLKRGADVLRVTKTNNTSLHLALICYDKNNSYNTERLVELLLKNAKANDCSVALTNVIDNKYGNTPLHIACHIPTGFITLNTIQLLLDYGASQSLYLDNKLGQKPIQLANKRNNCILVDFLQKKMSSCNHEQSGT